MASVIDIYYQKLFDLLLSPAGKIRVPEEYHEQMRYIQELLRNDKTALISTILEFMVHTSTIDINFSSSNNTLNNLLEDWKNNINEGVNLDIPRGLRSFTEQYFRERWKSSFIILRIKWKKESGFWIPNRMWFMDGGSIYVKNEEGKLNTNKYYFGKPNDKDTNILNESTTESILIRKPYNHWYDLYPTPYLVRKGALYHALFKTKILNKQAEVLDTALPYQLLIKMGSQEAQRRGQMPTEQDMRDMEKAYQEKKQKIDEHTFAKGLIGTFPFDVNFEELIPDYQKALDEKIIRPTDKNILNSLGLIELRGFSSNREEAILNPKVLVEEINDAVLDYVELLDDVVKLILDKNKIEHRNLTKNNISIEPGIIKSFITDEMRTMIRSWYDRGLVAKKSAIENTTPLNFEHQVKLRDDERKLKLNKRLYPPVTQNLEQNENDPSEPIDDLPDDKKPNTPEVKDYKNATEEIEIISEPMKSIRSIPDELRGVIKDKDVQRKFKEAFNEQFERSTKLKQDAKIREINSFKFAYNAIKEYLQAPYTKTNYPKQLENLPVGARNLWIRTFNKVLEETNNEDTARKSAWNNVKKQYKKNSDGNWVKR